jgi:hypothetical protein
MIAVIVSIGVYCSFLMVVDVREWLSSHKLTFTPPELHHGTTTIRRNGRYKVCRRQ